MRIGGREKGQGAVLREERGQEKVLGEGAGGVRQHSVERRRAGKGVGRIRREQEA